MEDYINLVKPLDSDDYWIPAKRPKAMASLRRTFPQVEWDVLTTTIHSQIPDEDKQHPARWLTQLTQHYLGEEPIIQSTHNFLRMLKQEPGMTIQGWCTLVRLEYQKCNFPTVVDDRLQRRRRRLNKDLTSLSFPQVISKARDFEASLQTESAITQQHLEEAAHKVTPTGDKSRRPYRPPRRPIPPES